MDESKEDEKKRKLAEAAGKDGQSTKANEEAEKKAKELTNPSKGGKKKNKKR
jgi:hypothetical protein